MALQDLPRDLQLEIVKRMDMDARIKLGIIWKLRVHSSLAEKLADKLSKRVSTPSYTEVRLSDRYMLYASKTLSNTDFYKCIVHTYADGVIECYYFDSSVNHWMIL